MRLEHNTERQVNIDLAKCIAIVFMVLIHTMMNYSADLETGLGYAANQFLGGFMAAPVFMCAMGIGIAYSKNQEPEKFLSRGFDIFVLGYVLNILRSAPVLLMLWPWRDNAGEVLYYLFNGDILQFAGLAMLVVGCLKKLHCTDGTILGIGIVCSVVGRLIPVIRSDNLFVDSVVGLFITCTASDEMYVVFPLMSWFVIVAFGCWFGGKIKNSENPDKFYLTWGIPCTIVWVCGSAYEAIGELSMMKDDLSYYGLAPWDAAISLCYCVSCFAVCYFVCKLLNKKTKDFIYTMSDSLNLFYMYHWVIAVFLMIATLEYVTTTPMLLLMTLITLVISEFAAVWTKNYIRSHKEKFRTPILRSL